MKKDTSLMPLEIIEKKIYFIRGVKVILDSDLAFLYQVPTKILIQGVKRNLKRFPADFMFQLSPKESAAMRSQFVTASKRNVRYQPYVFTEHGVAMLSSVLNNKKAIEINILIIRAFIKLRELLATHKDLILEIDKIKKEQKGQNQKIVTILSIINQMINSPVSENKEPIGFSDRTKKK